MMQCRSFRVGKANFYRWILLFQIAANTGQGAARPNGANKPVNFAISLPPDFRAGCLEMAVHIGNIVKLIGPNHPTIMRFRQFLGQTFRIADIIARILVGGGRHQS